MLIQKKNRIDVTSPRASNDNVRDNIDCDYYNDSRIESELIMTCLST